MEQTFTQAIAAIAADNQSGAAQIAERAADLLLQHASLGQTSSPDAFRHEILTVGWALIRAQAVMAPLVNLVNAVLWRMEQSDSPSGQRQAVAQATGEFKRQMHLHALNVAEGALGLIGEGSRVITLSFSSTIQHALIHAQRAGRHLEVLCAESLPGREGRATVELLRACGITITLLSDQEARQATAVYAMRQRKILATGLPAARWRQHTERDTLATQRPRGPARRPAVRFHAARADRGDRD